MSLFARLHSLRTDYDTLKSVGRDPFTIRFDQIVSPTEAILDGRPVTLMGTNNYLGLTFDEGCIEEAIAALRAAGTGTTGSRIANGTYAHHATIETRLARFFGRRSAMVFTTGYQANLGILSSVVGRGDHILIDADSHASIYDGCRLGAAEVIRFRHNDPDDLDRRLRRLGKSGGNKLIVVEGIYSMLGDVARLAEIAAVKRAHGAYLLIDEAHSMGVLGPTGRGLAEELGLEADIDFVVGTFSKSLGAIGGFCVSDHADFDLLRVVSRPYMFTASLPPSVVASVIQALTRVEEDASLRDTLKARYERLYAGLAASGFSLGPNPTPIVAIRLPDREVAVAFWNALLSSGVYMNLALPPATPDSHPLLRFSVSAAHTVRQIDAVIDAVSTVGTRFALIDEPRRYAAL